MASFQDKLESKRWWGGSGISWTTSICKLYAPRCR